MNADRARLRRMQRIERVRAIAAREAATKAAEAEGTLARLQALRTRTGAIAAGYDPARSADGAALADLYRFRGELERIATDTDRDLAAARTHADARHGERRQAERRRAMAEERVDACRRLADRRGDHAPATACKAIWHDT